VLLALNSAPEARKEKSSLVEGTSTKFYGGTTDKKKMSKKKGFVISYIVNGLVSSGTREKNLL